MKRPQHVIDTLNALHAERAPLAARLDAIELAEKNLQHIWAPEDAPDRRATIRRPPKERRLGPRRRTGVVKRTVVDAPRAPKAGVETSDAAARRELLLGLIQKSEIGLTLGELRKATPTMDGKDRSNAVQLLKSLGRIRRSGNTWVKA